MEAHKPRGANGEHRVRRHQHEPIQKLKVEERAGVPYTYQHSYCQHCGTELSKPRIARAVA